MRESAGQVGYETLEKSALISLLIEKDREITKLHHIITTANRKQFVTKSDKVLNQEALFEFPLPEHAPEAEKVRIAEHTRESRKGRKPLPANLPRERIEYLPENSKCAGCGEELTRIGEEVTEELEYTPASFKVLEHVRVKCACNKCKTGVICEPIPSVVQPLERSRPGVGLLTHIIISKYVDHLPLYRQEQMFLRDGALIPRQRMCDWIARICELLEPLTEALSLEVLTAKYLQADETTIKVQDPEKKDKCLTGFLWSLHVPGQLGFFRYFPTRAASAAQELLCGFRGTVQTDLYAGYNPVMLPGEVTRLACLAHVRRKFVDAAPTSPKECQAVIELIKQLYVLEDAKLAPRERLKIREEKSRPLLSKLKEYLEKLNNTTLPRAPLKEALEYALKQWSAIELYLSDGTFEIDNNAIERQIRPVAIGRKNWLFAGSHEGAARAAQLYSFFATCKIHGVNPREWLTFVLKNLSTPGFKAADLLPHRWKETSPRDTQR